MDTGQEAILTVDLLRKHLHVMAGIELSSETEEHIDLFAGLVATMNMLNPEGYENSIPAVTFEPVKE